MRSGGNAVARELYEIWEEEDGSTKMQLVNYVGTFPDQSYAERFAKAVREFRARETQVAVAAVKGKK